MEQVDRRRDDVATRMDEGQPPVRRPAPDPVVSAAQRAIDGGLLVARILIPEKRCRAIDDVRNTDVVLLLGRIQDAAGIDLRVTEESPTEARSHQVVLVDRAASRLVRREHVRDAWSRGKAQWHEARITRNPVARDLREPRVGVAAGVDRHLGTTHPNSHADMPRRVGVPISNAQLRGNDLRKVARSYVHPIHARRLPLVRRRQAEEDVLRIVPQPGDDIVFEPDRSLLQRLRVGLPTGSASTEPAAPEMTQVLPIAVDAEQEMRSRAHTHRPGKRDVDAEEDTIVAHPLEPPNL